MLLRHMFLWGMLLRGLFFRAKLLGSRFVNPEFLGGLFFSGILLGSTESIPSLHQIRRYPAPYISKAGQKATPSNILQPFIPHCFPLQSPYINSRPFISSPHYFYSSPIRFRICPTPAQPTSILTRIVFPADQQPILNDQFYVEEMPEEIVIVVKLIYSDRTHST